MPTAGRTAIGATIAGGLLSGLASAPERVGGLVVIGGYARLSSGDGYRHGLPRDTLLAFADAVAERWADPALVNVFAPSAAGDPGFLAWWERSSRKGLSRDGVRASLRGRASLDVRELAAVVRAPTLVIHREGDRVTPVEHGRWLAAHIPGAELLELPGEDHLWWVPDPDEIAVSIDRFAKEHTP
jgi:pimeloyl-ACP methyl ester carboxylesterase